LCVLRHDSLHPSYSDSTQGSRIAVSLKDGTRYEGILSAVSSEGDFSVALKQVSNPLEPTAPPKRMLLLLGKDIVDVNASDVDLERRVVAASGAQAVSDSFRTDTDISGANATGDGRLLQKWDAPTSHEGLGLDDAGGSKSGTGWDQFAVNERMFGAKTNYNEELYTTKLDRSSTDYKQKEKRADRLAAEILAVRASCDLRDVKYRRVTV
jgi:PAB1-binding protein PBP1